MVMFIFQMKWRGEPTAKGMPTVNCPASTEMIVKREKRIVKGEKTIASIILFHIYSYHIADFVPISLSQAYALSGKLGLRS